MIANWDGQCLTVCGAQKNAIIPLQFEMQDDEGFCELSPESLDAQVVCLLWPMEDLLVRQVAFDLPQVKLVDQDVLGNDIEESCGEDASQWWLSGALAKRDEQVTGLAFALAMPMRDALAAHPVWQQCPKVVPDVWVRLSALLPESLEARQAIIDEDESGLCLGVFDAQGCCAVRRINKTTWRSEAMLAEEVRRSLLAMQVDVSDTVIGCCGEVLSEHLAQTFAAWAVETVPLVSRKDANVKALRSLLADEQSSWLNLRHGMWAIQKKIQWDWKNWRLAAGLAVLSCVILLAGQGMQVSQLQQRHDVLKQNIEALRAEALPQGTQGYEPLGQLRKAAEHLSDVDRWSFLKHLEAIAALLKKEPSVVIEKIQFKKSQLFLSAYVKDFAAVNRVQKVLADLLGVDVVVDDTELENQTKVRFRMRWS